MKRRIIKFIASIVTSFAFFFTASFLSSCEKLVSVESIEMKDGQHEITVEVGKFDYSNYSIIVNYDDGTSEEEELKEEYISAEDQLKLYSVGTYEIAVNAHMRECSFTLTVLRHHFSEDIKLNDLTVPFTGEEYSVTVEGSLPAGTKVTYSNGNAFTNVGTYECYAILTCEGYVTTQLTCNVNIEKADYNMSGVYFDKDVYTYEYDGKSKSVSLTGELPEGVEVSYSINGEAGNKASKANEYIITASFTNNNPNYNDIPSKSTKMIIEKSVIDTSSIEDNLTALANQYVEYDGKSHNLVYNASLPEGVVLEETAYYNANDEKIKNMVNAGTYKIALTLSALDDKNYELSESYFESEFIINKKIVISNNIYFDNLEVDYDGKPHTLVLTGEHIDGLNVIYEVEGYDVTEFTDAGIYTFKATIPEDENYLFEEVNKEATLTIFKVKSGYSDITDSKIIRKTYTGQEFAWDFSFIPKCLNYEYDVKTENGDPIDKLINVGSYVYTVTFTNTHNYNDVPDTCEYYLEITEATLDISSECYQEYAYEYTGNPIPYPVILPDNGASVNVDYLNSSTTPKEIGVYDIRLTFFKANYTTVVKDTKLSINKAIIHDNLNKDEIYEDLMNAKFEYNDGNPIDLSAYTEKIVSAKIINQDDEIPSSLYYYGESGSDIQIRMSLIIRDSANQIVDKADELGDYTFELAYSFVEAQDSIYLDITPFEGHFEVIKKNVTLLNGIDFEFYDANEKYNNHEVSSFNYLINFRPLNDDIGVKYSYDGFTIKNSKGEIAVVKEADTYHFYPEFNSEYYNITTDEITFTVNHVNLDNITFRAYFSSSTEKTKYVVYPYVQIDGATYSGVEWNTYTRTLGGFYGLSPDITISYEIRRFDPAYYRLETQVLEHTDHGDGIYFFCFTITNGAGESKQFYSYPETPYECEYEWQYEKYCAVQLKHTWY